MNYRSETMLQWCRDHHTCELRCSPRCLAVTTHGFGPLRTPFRPDPCHANWADFGKGKSQKAHDWAAVPGCRECHDWLDFGGSPNETKLGCFVRGLARWFTILFLDGRLGPAIDNEQAEVRRERVRDRHSKRKQHGSRSANISKACPKCNNWHAGPFDGSNCPAGAQVKL